MNDQNKSFASRLSNRICTAYLALALLLLLCQIYFIHATHTIDMAYVNVHILMTLITLTTTMAGLWMIVRFFTNQLLTKPLRQFIRQIKPLEGDKLIPTPDIGELPSIELADLRNSFIALSIAVASKQRMLKTEAAEKVSLAKLQFLAAAGHDLRQPMHALNLYLASLSELEVSKSVEGCVNNLNKCAKAMNDMLDTLLEMANIDSGATQAQLNIFPIASPIDRIQAEFEPLARTKGLQLRIARCSAFVETDEEIVERMLRLLVSNAVRYTTRGKILIGCRRRGAQLRVAVIDTGLGIEADKQQAIFEEHVQLDNYERNRAKGLGLGLAIVQRLARLLKTTITLESTPGSGSMFAFDLPEIALDAIQPCSPNQTRLTLKQKRPEDLTIIIIDDEPLIADATRMILESWGYNVITANSGQNAIDELAKNLGPPDIIICDYLLGGNENGVNIIAMLRAAYNQEIPAFLVTGVTLPTHIEEIRASGLTYMYKPLDQAKLKTIISTHL